MTRLLGITPRFVEEVPYELEDGVLYVSVEYGTVVHRCCCGCGAEVVTPLHPSRWEVTWDGETVSLHPSVGSWALSCRSHYVIENSVVRWARSWTDEEVTAGRRRDRALTNEYFGATSVDAGLESDEARTGHGGRLHAVRSSRWAFAWRFWRR